MILPTDLTNSQRNLNEVTIAEMMFSGDSKRDVAPGDSLKIVVQACK